MKTRTKPIHFASEARSLRLAHTALNDKYSPNLWRFLNSKSSGIQSFLRRARVFRAKNGELWIGCPDKMRGGATGIFWGTRLLRILSQERPSIRNCEIVERPLFYMKEIVGFWRSYERIGRCAIDTSHETDFVEGYRWSYEPGSEVRVCRWCKKCRQFKKRTEVIRERITWVRSPFNLNVRLHDATPL